MFFDELDSIAKAQGSRSLPDNLSEHASWSGGPMYFGLEGFFDVNMSLEVRTNQNAKNSTKQIIDDVFKVTLATHPPPLPFRLMWDALYQLAEAAVNRAAKTTPSTTTTPCHAHCCCSSLPKPKL
jgi:hypothetical protein